MEHPQLQETDAKPNQQPFCNRDGISRSTRSKENVRRISTDVYPQPSPERPNSGTEDMVNDDSFSFPTTRSCSWESQSDSEDRTKGPTRRDRRKYDTTTPTLIDEDSLDEEEEEIVSLERARLRQQHRGFIPEDATSLRRTPGASMYKSCFQQQSRSAANLRRTPGANDMHRSAGRTGIVQDSANESSVLGFGLTLSTPVGGDSRTMKDKMKTWQDYSSESSASPPDEGANAQYTSRPPLPPESGNAQSEKTVFSFGPWSLSKNAQLGATHGACSPNTLRLTEDLGNLLFEEECNTDEYRSANQNVFRGDAEKIPRTKGKRQASNDESWTASYVFETEKVSNIPSRVPRSGVTRTRRSKQDSRWRSRGNERVSSKRHSDEPDNKIGFLPHAQQPKPVRSMQTGLLGNHFFGTGFDNSSPGAAEQNDNDEHSSPRLLNFGGAFAPPSKDTCGTFMRVKEQPKSNSALFPVASQPQRPPQASSPRDQGPMSFHSQTFQPLPRGTAYDTQRQPPFQQAFHAPDPCYGSAVINSTPDYVTYPIPHPRVQPPSHEFYPMNIHAPQRAPVSHFPSQEWSGIMPMYDGGIAQGKWIGSSTGWMGDYGYGIPSQPPQEFRMGPASVPQVASWQDTGISSCLDFQSQPATGMVPPPQMELPPHQMMPATITPIMLCGATGAVRGEQQHRQKREINVRKLSTRKGSKQVPKNEKGKKSETSAMALTMRKPSVSTRKKKQQQKGKDLSSSAIDQGCNSIGCGDDGALLTSDGPADAKRSELVESPATRSAFKEFYRKFRAEERDSFRSAEDFALQSLEDGSLPANVHWRVYLELADLAKRSNRFVEARQLYQQVCHLQPYASQGWLEYSKLEEECGHLNRSAKILRAGLEFCEYSENLLTKAIKHEEKMGNLNRARELLARLKHVGIEKVWRTVLEGALLEARAGNEVMARRVLKYLMHHVPWYGPLYLEAYRLEKDLGRPSDALAVVERGVSAIPRYGPLWFGGFRLCEEMDVLEKAYDLPMTMAMIERATSSISKELIWKVHLDAAQMLERAALDQINNSIRIDQVNSMTDEILAPCRRRFVLTILTCPPNLRWKVWLAAGRMEAAAGNASRSRQLFRRAHFVVPEKGRATTLLECARLEEFVGDTELASAILCKCRHSFSSDWKVWLESVLLEIRRGNYSRAIMLAKAALQIHPGTGRLWAALVQLHFFEGGEEPQFNSLKCALNCVPKSGEVWCEGGRIHLNPFSKTFDLDIARRHLFFATKFTPQYGDSFLETLRLELLVQWISPIADFVWQTTRDKLTERNVSNNQNQLVQYISDVALGTLTACQSSFLSNQADSSFDDLSSIFNVDVSLSIRQSLDPIFRERIIDLTELELKCANADPNYGVLWFHCREGPTDTARRILARATENVISDLQSFFYIYVAAMVRRKAVLEMTGDKYLRGLTIDTAEWEKKFHGQLLSAPSLKTILDLGLKDRGACMGLSENTLSGSLFATGLSELNKHKPIENMSLNERRKPLFGTDALFS